MYPKEAEIVKLIKNAKDKNRKVWIFCEYTNKRDVTERLKSILSKEKISVEILRSSVSPELRETWIEKKVISGVDVIISGAKLVETGIDLLAFPEIVFYEQPLSCYTLRQASRRSWRLNQKFPVNVTYLYYNSTMQSRMVKLLGAKLSACMALEGKISSDGLVGISSDSMIVELAKELVNGIKADKGAEAVWRKINESNKSKTTKTVIRTEEIVVPVREDNKPEDSIIYLDFLTSGVKKKRKREIIAVKSSEIQKLMQEKGQDYVQLSLFG